MLLMWPNYNSRLIVMFQTLTMSDKQNIIVYNNDSKIKLLTERNHSKTYLEQNWETPDDDCENHVVKDTRMTVSVRISISRCCPRNIINLI